MTSQSHTASVGVPRRPAPPRPAAASASSAAPVTYVPDQYDPRHAPSGVTSTPGQFGLVYPQRRTGRGVWLILLLIIGSAAAFVVWRAGDTGASAQPGVAYTSAAGHFSARFPAQPTEFARTEQDGRTRLTVHFAFVVRQGLVGEVEVRGPIDGNVDELGQRLAASVGSTNHLDLSNVTTFTFQGMRARQGNFIQPSTGDLMTSLLIAASERRVYLVLGLTGPTFDALKDSFAVTP